MIVAAILLYILIGLCFAIWGRFMQECEPMEIGLWVVSTLIWPLFIVFIIQDLMKVKL